MLVDKQTYHGTHTFHLKCDAKNLTCDLEWNTRSYIDHGCVIKNRNQHYSSCHRKANEHQKKNRIILIIKHEYRSSFGGEKPNLLLKEQKNVMKGIFEREVTLTKLAEHDGEIIYA